MTFNRLVILNTSEGSVFQIDSPLARLTPRRFGDIAPFRKKLFEFPEQISINLNDAAVWQPHPPHGNAQADLKLIQL
jgi:hypothetical protein